MNLTLFRRPMVGVLGAACALTLLGGASAQSAATLPASIIAGSCASPGASAATLANLGVAALGSSTPAAGGLSPAGAAVIPVVTSVTTVPMKLADIVDGAHAVSVSLAGAQSGTVAACGNLGSNVNNGDVVVGLAGTRGSRYSGIAWLHDSGGQTQVTVFLAQNANPTSQGGENEGEGDAG